MSNIRQIMPAVRDTKGSHLPEIVRTPLAVGRLVELLLPLLLLAALIALCVQLLVPFIGLLLWTIILSVCFYPVHHVHPR